MPLRQTEVRSNSKWDFDDLIHSDESKYYFACNSIFEISSKNKYNKKIDDTLDQLLKKVANLKDKNKAPLNVLTEILTDTHNLLTGDLTPAAYEAKAQKVQGNSSLALKVLGGIMITLSALVAAAGVVLIATGIGAVPGAAAMAGGTAGIAAGMGLFSVGKQGGVAKAMTEFKDAFTEKHTAHKTKP